MQTFRRVLSEDVVTFSLQNCGDTSKGFVQFKALGSYEVYNYKVDLSNNSFATFNCNETTY